MRRAVLFLGLLCSALSCGCATAGRGTSGPPPGVTAFYKQVEYRLGARDDRSWYTLDVFENEMREIQRRFDEAGVPGHVQTQFKEQLKTTYGMRHAMKREIERGDSSFLYVWLQLKPETRLMISPGAFLVELVDPRTGTRQVVADRGALIWHWDGQDRDYDDTGRSPCLVDSDTQQRKDRRPIDLYLRLPSEYLGWELVSVNPDPDGVRVHDR